MDPKHPDTLLLLVSTSAGENQSLRKTQIRFTNYFSSQLDRTPPDANRGSYPPRSQGYDTSLANHGPSSRPPPHPAIHSNPYDDPYYYYGTLEMGAGPSLGGAMNSPRGTGQAGMAGLRLDAGLSGGITKTVTSSYGCSKDG